MMVRRTEAIMLNLHYVVEMGPCGHMVFKMSHRRRFRMTHPAMLLWLYAAFLAKFYRPRRNVDMTHFAQIAKDRLN